MKILMINVSCGTGSTGRICTDLASSLEKQGHIVKIAYGRSLLSGYESKAIRVGGTIDVDFHALFARMFDAAGLGSYMATIKFLKWVESFNPDIIHLHNIHGYYIHIPLLFRYLSQCGKPIIWTLHDCWAFTGHAAFCDSANCTRWESGCYRCPLIREYPRSFFDNSKRNWKWKKRVMRGLPRMTLITPSQWLAGLVKKSFLSDYPVEVIHNGIDTSAFRPLKNDFREYYHIEDKTIILGMVGDKDASNEFTDFLTIAKQLGDQYVVVLVGLDDKQQERVPENVIAFSRIDSPKELAYISSASDIFLNLSYNDHRSNFINENVPSELKTITYTSRICIDNSDLNSVMIERGNVNRVLEEVKKVKHTLYKRRDYEGKKETENDESTTRYKEQEGYFAIKQRLNFLHKKVILGVASVWDYRKGLDTFIKLSGVLSTEYYQIILVGLTKEQMKMVPSEIISISKTKDVLELRKLYGIADVFVNPTIEDNYPTTNIEAACCGTPVITYRTGGSPESVNSKQVIDIGEIEKLQNMIMMRNLKVEKHDDFNAEIMIDSYLELYARKCMQ